LIPKTQMPLLRSGVVGKRSLDNEVQARAWAESKEVRMLA